MLSFYSRFAECAERFPDGIAIEMQRNSGLESFSYSELRQMAESVGSWLAENGFRPGTRCAILAANGPRWVAAYLGIIAAGSAHPGDVGQHGGHSLHVRHYIRSEGRHAYP